MTGAWKASAPLFGIVDEQLFAVIGRGAHLVHWRRTSEHCGVCGVDHRADRPRLRAPLSILRVQPHFPASLPPSWRWSRTDRGACWRAGRRFQAGLFSCLAGFVEPGETLEQAICREVHEEVGLEVAELRYFGSQPWPYPDGLMIAFQAKYAGGEIRLRDDELREARWFDVTELPLLPGSFSLARQLIEDFRSRVPFSRLGVIQRPHRTQRIGW